MAAGRRPAPEPAAAGYIGRGFGSWHLQTRVSSGLAPATAPGYCLVRHARIVHSSAQPLTIGHKSTTPEIQNTKQGIHEGAHGAELYSIMRAQPRPGGPFFDGRNRAAACPVPVLTASACPPCGAATFEPFGLMAQEVSHGVQFFSPEGAGNLAVVNNQRSSIIQRQRCFEFDQSPQFYVHLRTLDYSRS